MSNYWAHAWYLFECLEVSRSLDGETYSMLQRNYGILLSTTRGVPLEKYLTELLVRKRIID
ncbi:hypothetical protein T02_10080 [Trichinella nativa]|uniref:Uncharacterized protein n=1 Tax=Trichinella nativa TaxID=6335 RepID=A0A0V1LR96_9BILA|nr:hypothetical protein T02_10080 [Trichinella nativa]